MAFDIHISGDIVPYSIWPGENVVNAEFVESELAKAGSQDVKVHINSRGGDIDEGFTIYALLRKYAADNDAKITTYAKGRCQSIATIIFLAGDVRIGNRFLEPFVHEAWTYVEGESGDLLKASVELEQSNTKIANFYAEHTDLTFEQARDLMAQGSFITPEESLNIRFATEIEEILRPVALNKIVHKKRTAKKPVKTIQNKSIKVNKMAKKTEKSFMAHMREFFNLEDKNAVEVFTSENEALVFPDLEEGETPAKGDKATIGGEAANGSYTLQDGTVYEFVEGELTEITDPDSDDDTVVEIQNLRKENEELKSQISAQNKKIDNIVKAHKEQETRWNKLKTVVSKYAVDSDEDDDPDEGSTQTRKPKTPGFNKAKRAGLSAAAGKLGKRKTESK